MHNETPGGPTGAEGAAVKQPAAGEHEAAAVVRECGDLFGRAVTDGAVAEYLELLDPEVDYELFSVMAGHVVRLRGRSEVRTYIEEMVRRYEELRLDLRELRDLGDERFLVLGRWRGQARGGSPFGAPLASIVEVRDGRVSRLRGFMDERDALAAI